MTLTPDLSSKEGDGTRQKEGGQFRSAVPKVGRKTGGGEWSGA
jgi:hypothetical protein